MKPALMRLALAGALSAWACATVHPLPESQRIQFGIDGGLYYWKDGRRTPVGALGGDLPSLVADDAEAVRFARRGRRELSIGVPAYLCGLAVLVLGLAAVEKPAGWIVAGGGLVVTGTGVGFMGAGAVNLLDAVNTYNGDLGARQERDPDRVPRALGQ